MPKERRDRSVSRDTCRASPYPKRKQLSKDPIDLEPNSKEWEEARCPVCMEHPHNAVLLVCSSHHKGCRPFMCDTSYRHSNCLDQFRKSSSSSSPEPQNPEAEVDRSAVLHCPLCRGEIKEWVVVDGARRFMNAKPRTCSCETCSFSGSYVDLRKHARTEHPGTRPSEADPERERSWRRLERQRDIGDLLSTLQSSMSGSGSGTGSGSGGSGGGGGGEEDEDDESVLPMDEGSWLTVFFLIRVFRPETASRSRSWSGPSRARAHLSIRRSNRLWGESYEDEAGSAPREEENEEESSDGGSDPWRRIRRRTTPDDNRP